MTDDRTDYPDVRIGQVVNALRDQPIPEGPDAAVYESVLAALASTASPQSSALPQTGWRSDKLRRMFSLAATVVLAAAVIGWLASQSRRTDGTAFAQMIQRVTTARTARFTTRLALPGQSEVVAQTTLMEPGWMRQVISHDKIDLVQVLNTEQNKMLVLLPQQKQAQLMSLAGLPEQSKNANIIDKFRKLDPSRAELLGEEEIDGRRVLKYRYDDPAGYYIVWLDAEKKLPVKVAMSDTDKATDDATENATENATESDMEIAIEIAIENEVVTMTDLEWNISVDKSQFSFDIPADFQFDFHTFDLANTTEKDFTTLLRICARWNDDEFPGELNPVLVKELGEVLDRPVAGSEEEKRAMRKRLAYAYDRPELTELSDEERQRLAPELAVPVARGAIFLTQLADTKDWHYVGKGVKLGEAGKIVAWWAPKKRKGDTDRSSATVLFGDLHTETRAVETLPTEPTGE
jgi:outer membrane lipoprotein-sorting protein